MCVDPKDFGPFNLPSQVLVVLASNMTNTNSSRIAIYWQSTKLTF